MKKTISILLLATIVIVSLFSGCGNNVASPQVSQLPEKVEQITVWHYYNADIKAEFDKLVREFNETVGKEKGIVVDAYSQGGVNELADRVYAAAIGEVGSTGIPDIFASYADSAYKLYKLGVIADLQQYFTEEEISLYRQEFLSEGKFIDGNIKIIPIAKSTELLFINISEFNKFAEETGATLQDLSTWEGIAKTAENYYEWSNGKAMFGLDSFPNFIIIATKQLGEDILSESSGKYAFNLSEENAKRIWDNMYVPYIKGHYASVGGFRSDDVKSGKIIMFTGSNSSASFFPKNIEIGKDSSYSIDSNVMHYPHFEDGDKVSIHQGAGMIVTKSNEEKEKACVEFLRWLTAPEQNSEFTSSTSYLPVQNKALSLEESLKHIGTEDQEDIRVQTNKAAYSMLEEYQLYAATPNNTSYEIRKKIDDLTIKRINKDLQEINNAVSSGKNKEVLIAEYISDENFKLWYNELLSQINLYLE